MDLGEAVQTAIERGLPLLLSSEAAGAAQGHGARRAHEGPPRHAHHHHRRRRSSATTRRVVAEQAIAELRDAQALAARTVTLDAGARQLVRMVRARPLADDPVLLGRQRELAALKVVGSGVDASPDRHRQDDHQRPRARAPRRHHAALPRAGRRRGPAARPVARRAARRRARRAGCRRWRPTSTCSCSPTTARSPAQIRALRPRARRPRPASCWCANGVLDRHPGRARGDRLAPADRRRGAALRQPRHRRPPGARAACGCRRVADCWLLTATPRGKSAEHLDVLVGLALGDEAMIRERLNTREAGDLLDELNAHRLRVNYGPHLVRVTRQDMQAWMPEVRPAQPLALEADAALAELLEAIRQRRPRRLPAPARAAARAARRSSPAAPLYKQALAELARAQGVVLGNVGVFVDASVDPETLTHSQGRARPGARRAGPRRPRRCAAAATACRCCAASPPRRSPASPARSRCSCSPSACAACASSPRTLRERHGVEAHVADGSLTGRDFEALKQRFTRRRVPGPVPLAASATRATTSRTPRVLVPPRPAVAARPGSSSASAAPPAPAPCAAGCRPTSPTSATPGSRTSSRCSRPRGGEHHQILDSYEGVAAADSTLATQLGADHRRDRRRTRTTPATPAPPPGCASPRACSAPCSDRPRAVDERRQRLPQLSGLLLRRSRPRCGGRGSAAPFLDADRRRRRLDLAGGNGLRTHSAQCTASPASQASVWTTMRTPKAPEIRDIHLTRPLFSSRNAW